MDQDYKTVETANKKHQVKIRSYITRADEEAVTELYTAAADVNIDIVDDEKGKPQQNRKVKVDLSVEGRVTRLKVSRFVVDIDGSTADMAERLYNLPSGESKPVFDFIETLTKQLNLESSLKGFEEDVEKKD